MKLLVRSDQTNEVEMWDQPEQFKALADSLKQWRYEEKLTKPPKFIVMAKSGENFLVIFGEKLNHDDQAEALKDYTFVGAGRWQVSDNPQPYYRSNTCFMTFGYEQPEDRATSIAVLTDVEQTLKAIVAACR